MFHPFTTLNNWLSQLRRPRITSAAAVEFSQEEPSTEPETASNITQSEGNALFRLFGSLPNEILCMIFQAVVDESNPAYYTPNPWLLRITHVCQRWRDVALHTPALWIYIRIDAQPAHCNTAVWELWLARSKRLSIHVSIELRKLSRTHRSTVLKALRTTICPQLASRCASLSILCHSDFIYASGFISSPIPKSEPILDAPPLPGALILRLDIDLAGIKWHQSRIVDILRLCPNVEKVSIVSAEAHKRLDTPADLLESGSVELISLRRLEMDASFVCAADLLNAIIAPHLSDFKITSSKSPFEPVAAPRLGLDAFPILSLELSGFRFTETYQTVPLREVPKLRRLFMSQMASITPAVKLMSRDQSVAPLLELLDFCHVKEDLPGRLIKNLVKSRAMSDKCSNIEYVRFGPGTSFYETSVHRKNTQEYTQEFVF